MQAAEWARPSIAALFQPPIWQGPVTWGAPFADMLVEFLEAKWETAAAEPSYDVHCSAGAPAAQSPSPRADSEGRESQAGACLQQTHDHPMLDQGEDSRDDDQAAGPSQWSPHSVPQVTAAQLLPGSCASCTMPGTASGVSTACMEAQSCEAWRTAFQAVHPPAIGLTAYMQRIGRYAGFSTVCLVYACAYMIRLESYGVLMTPLTIHRLLGTGVVLAAKHVEDTVWTNAHYARVTGIALTELNHMELVMCSMLDFALWLRGPKDVLNTVRQPWPLKLCWLRYSYSQHSSTCSIFPDVQVILWKDSGPSFTVQS